MTPARAPGLNGASIRVSLGWVWGAFLTNNHFSLLPLFIVIRTFLIKEKTPVPL